MTDEALLLHLDGFDGPLDLLLDLARAQKVDLARISIVALVDQYLALLAGVRLELAADWLVMAAWLAWLKSRLLLPAGPDEADEGESAGASLAARLRELEAVRGAAAELAARPQLGRDVFARGAPEDFVRVDRSGLSLQPGALVRAYMAALRRAGGRRAYTPRPAVLWSVQDALGRMGTLLRHAPEWSALERFVPPGMAGGLHRRAAVASTLIASLELAKSGALRLRQEQPFGPILLHGGA